MFSCFGLLRLFLNGCRKNDDSFVKQQFDSLEFPLNEQHLRNYRTNRIGEFPSVRNRNINITLPPKSLDIIPRSTDILDGDWILRCSDSEASVHPWSEQRNLHNFDLVPWKRPTRPTEETKFESFSWATKEQNRILKRLHKLETKQNRDQVKKRLCDEQKVKKRVRVKVIFTFELRQKTMEVLTPKFVTRSFQQQFYQHQIREMPSVFSQETFRKHLGYFTQREKENFYEQLETDFRYTGSTWKSNKFSTQKSVNKYKRINSHKSLGSESKVAKTFKDYQTEGDRNGKAIDLLHILCDKCKVR
jgi:hypothetical protein